MIAEVHQFFINAVKAGRGDRLRKDDPNLFSGLIWNGMQAKKLGLIDDFGSAEFVAKHVIGAERMVEFSPEPDFFKEISRRFGVQVAEGLMSLMQPSLSIH